MSALSELTEPDSLRDVPDEGLDALRVAVLTEQERRQRVADGPARLAAETRVLAAAGCTPDALRGAVEDALAPEHEGDPT